MRQLWLLTALISLANPALQGAEVAGAPQLVADVMPLLRARCVKCHGPSKSEAKLNLSTPGMVARGGESGAAIVSGMVDASLLWQRIEADEMPPDDPLSGDEKALVKAWISAGAAGLPKPAERHASGDHWAFLPPQKPAVPSLRDASAARNDVDWLLLAELEKHELTFSGEADRGTLIRRVSFDLTGLPPTPLEIERFARDASPDAYARMVDRYLASPHYGERWGKYWLDAAGYADSNGYFNADSDRPLAYRYRDYVVRAVNEDKPFDQFVVEQLAGDELSGFVAGQDATPDVIALLEATHYLRNGQDGTGESDGNPEELRNDRYAALDSCMQIVSSSLLGLTIQCAKCHDHKFEPLAQREYYELQSVFYPAFNVENWTKPNDRVVYANLPGELAAWQRKSDTIAAEIAALKIEHATWMREHRPPSTVLFHDEFAADGPKLAEQWSNTAPGDDGPAGTPEVRLDSAEAPGALANDGRLQILESGAAGDRWLSTKQAFDWTPEQEGEWVQATFDLIDHKAGPDGKPAERIAYFLALVDFNDNGATPRGNLLVDGNPAGGAAVFVDYPGADQEPSGELGNAKYEPGHNYGLRITRIEGGKFRVEHLYDGLADEKTVTLRAEDLPDGGFGFEYCCARSFVVDNVIVERSVADSASDETIKELARQRKERQEQHDATLKAKEAERGERPGKIALVTDRSKDVPEVFLLERGDHRTPGAAVKPAALSALAEDSVTLDVRQPGEVASTGRRLAWARWLTRKGSRPAALLARVQVNRIWQQHFGAGIVTTTANLGVSGAPPSHPELLEYLAGELVEGGWSMKSLHRMILTSAAYRQSSALADKAFAIDPNNRLLWRMSLKRLDAEALRDAMLATSGRLDRRFGGAYVPTARDALGEVIVVAGAEGVNRRSLYLQQRRTQTLSLLGVFDSPSLVFNCLERPVSTIPLQSLSLLNSDFVIEQARGFAARLAAEAGDEAEARVARAFLLAAARAPTTTEQVASLAFVRAQQAQYAAQADGASQAWTDLCQMLLAANSFLYVE